MALTTTTLSAAVGVNDTQIKVTSATGFTKGFYIRVNDEFMLQSGDASGSFVPVIRGQLGTYNKAHASGANATAAADSDDFAGAAPAVIAPYQIAGRRREITSYSASGAITLPTPGTDMVAVLNGTSVLAMTVAAPTKDQDGDLLYVASNGAAAHTVTFTGGLSLAGTSYDVLTVNATAPVLLGPFMAVNAKWQCAVTVAMSGTVTNITAALA